MIPASHSRTLSPGGTAWASFGFSVGLEGSFAPSFFAAIAASCLSLAIVRSASAACAAYGSSSTDGAFFLRGDVGTAATSTVDRLFTELSGSELSSAEELGLSSAGV
jgi:hypothetical protein